MVADAAALGETLRERGEAAEVKIIPPPHKMQNIKDYVVLSGGMFSTTV
jgi:hypothetical protein